VTLRETDAEDVGTAWAEPVDADPAQEEPDPAAAPESAPAADPAAEAAPVLDDPTELAAALEAVLFVLDAPVSVPALAAALERPTAEIADALDRVRRGYDDRRAGIELREVAGGVRLYTRPSYAPIVEKYLRDGQRSRLTQAALETLAVIAYRQPVTRARVAAIRGVNVDGVVRTLLSRGLIAEVGADPETGGGLFATTELFLEKMGLQSAAELPSLAPLLPDLDTLDDDVR
jgi:segregation and condensation protein B